ncbi:hypothetical protein D3878_21825 [Noviherbaspirillum sedimenti]|uniref:Uncharacterized protein n=1 Tax=Noviherbaspirillum sedimenti TaxID=2320865 RepID=A0A3A3G8E0_9BURK|nr:hypothetical protein [Noviherbaspirillum sedimenti]RJG03905.1 hypothetical protein D3878_21825 [Noviherbaspirillum sedimenti]
MAKSGRSSRNPKAIIGFFLASHIYADHYPHLFIAAHDEEHIGNVIQMLKAALQHMRARIAIPFAAQEPTQPGNPAYGLCQ